MVAHPSRRKRTELLLLDTNILIIYAREGEPAQRLESQLGIRANRQEAVVFVVTIGEALAFAKQRGWGDRRVDAFKELVRTRLVPVGLDSEVIQASYAEIAHFSSKVMKPARSMGQNDMWIAATAMALDCTLVTTDRDFDHLDGTRIRRVWIDPTDLKP